MDGLRGEGLPIHLSGLTCGGQGLFLNELACGCRVEERRTEAARLRRVNQRQAARGAASCSVALMAWNTSGWLEL
jgi:hypothetical protein